MNDKITLKYNGNEPVNFRAPGVMKFELRKGDLIEGVSRETYNNELKDDPRYSLVSEKPVTAETSNTFKSKYKNKMEKPTESEE